jgi:hypothetical protein
LPKFPAPPAPGGLARVPPEYFVVANGALLWRIYKRGGSHPMAWNQFRSSGPATSRFDHRECTCDRRILYAAKDVHTPFAECFQDTRVIDRTLDEPWLVGFKVVRDITLLDLTGPWPTRAGASQALSSGARSRAREWSRRIYEDYAAVEGLYYPSSMHGATYVAVALYERAEDSLPGRPSFHRALADPTLGGLVAQSKASFGYDVRP